MSRLPKTVYTSNGISIKLPMAFSSELEQKNCLICIETKKTPKYPKTIWRKKNGPEGITRLYFKLYYKTTVIKIVQYGQQNQIHRSMEQHRKPRNDPTHLWSMNLQQRK